MLIFLYAQKCLILPSTKLILYKISGSHFCRVAFWGQRGKKGCIGLGFYGEKILIHPGFCLDISPPRIPLCRNNLRHETLLHPHIWNYIGDVQRYFSHIL